MMLLYWQVDLQAAAEPWLNVSVRMSGENQTAAIDNKRRKYGPYNMIGCLQS